MSEVGNGPGILDSTKSVPGTQYPVPGPSYETRRVDLRPEVRSYAEKLHARVKEIYAKYGATDAAGMYKRTKRMKAGEAKAKGLLADAKELMALLGKLAYLLDNKEFGPGMELEVKKEKLYASEEAILSSKFKRRVEVPALPDWITLEKMEEWERKRLELHYLPPFDMSEESPEGWVKPHVRHIDLEKMPPDFMVLPGCWVVCDGRPKPKYENSDTMYEDDEEFLSPVLEGLVKARLINKWGLNPKSRFFVSLYDLNKPEVMAALAGAYGLKPGDVAVQRMVEFNALGNLHHPEWGEPSSESAEWFNEKVLDGEYKVYGGDGRSGGLSSLFNVYPGENVNGIAFRLVGHLK